METKTVYTMKKELLLSDVVLTIINSVNNPEDAEKAKAVVELEHKILVRQYIPIKEKEMIILCIVNDLDPVNDHDIVSGNLIINLELSLFINGLLEYTNIENDLGATNLLAGVYDYFYVSGVFDYILQFCQHDFDRLRQLVNNMLQIENSIQLFDILDNIDMTNIDATLLDLKNTIHELGPDTVKELLASAKQADPLITKIKENLELNALVQNLTIQSDK